MAFKPLPIGVDDFENIFDKGYYYADKTLMIKELLDKKGKVNLFTRPRRFGKRIRSDGAVSGGHADAEICQAEQL